MVPSDDERDDDADERLQWSAIAKAKPIAIAAVPTTVFGTHKNALFSQAAHSFVMAGMVIREDDIHPPEHGPTCSFI